MKSKSTLEGILFEKGKINKEQLQQIQAAKKDKNTDTEKLIITNRWATEKEIAETISEVLDIPFIDLSRYIIDPAAINAVHKDVARRLKVLPLYAVKDVLTVAMADPLDPFARDDLKISSSYKKIQIVTATRSAVLNGIEAGYSGPFPLPHRRSVCCVNANKNNQFKESPALVRQPCLRAFYPGAGLHIQFY